MGYSYYVDEDYGVAVIRPKGRFDETEFMEVLKSVYGHPERTSAFAHVWDARDIDELTMGTDVIAQYKSFLKENPSLVSGGRVAVIATSSTTRLFSSMLRGINEQWARQSVQILHTKEAAAEWLDVPVDILRDIPDEEWTSS